MPVISAQDTGGANVLAFLNILAFSEGTSTIKASEDGYNVMVGGKLFNDYRSPPHSRRHSALRYRPDCPV